MPSGGDVRRGATGRLVCELCREHDLFLLYDAAMERLLFDGRPLVHPLHFEGMAERTVVVGSLSKEHRMIGWRVGWVAGPAATIEDVGWAHVYNTTTPVGIARARRDRGAARRPGPRRRVRRRARAPPRLRSSTRFDGWPVVKPGGGWSLLLDVAELGIEPEDASRLLLEEAVDRGDARCAGGAADVAERHVRFVYSAEPLERLRGIPKRLEKSSLRR